MAQPSPRHVLIAFSPDLASRVLEVGAFLERFGFHVATATTETECLAACGHSPIDAVVFDLAVAGRLGADVWLGKLKLISPLTVPIAVGSFAEIAELRRTSQEADGDYVLFPLSLVELKNRLKRIVDLRDVAGSGVGAGGDPERVPADTRSLGDLVGHSPAIEAIRERVRKVAGLTSTVLITGESGVGKELIARAIHRASPRRDRPFVAINCSALPESLLESELFGHEKGAFTGAQGLSKGKFELAHQGTLFLDEIGDMDPRTQVKILRVLEEKEFMRVGGSRNLRVDVRLVAATNADLQKRMAEGRFREDLYYRLKVLTLEVPPLRARREDLPELLRAFIDKFCRENAIAPRRVTDDALEILSRYRWPGNIRELRNTVENLIVSAPADVIDVDDIPASLRSDAAREAPGAMPEARPVGSMEQMEKEAIRSALVEVGGNRTRAAQILKIGVRTLQRKIKRYGLEQSETAS